MNNLTAEQLHVRPTSDGRVVVDPATAGWRYLSFRTSRLSGAQTESLDPALEHGVVVVSGASVALDVSGSDSLIVAGRPSPFDRLPGAAYIPAGRGGVLRTKSESLTSLVAIASAPPSGRAGVATTPLLITPSEVRVEIRGAGNATRQINHIITPDFAADRLELVEVLTPSGNWSSWPPHKHDVDDMPNEAVLEEIYHYQFRRTAAWGLQRVYRADRSRDHTFEVHGGDVVVVTDGYHPFVAAHGDDAYYLNALAGDRRTMACSFDPELDWVRDTWTDMQTDPRLPLVDR